MRAPCKKEPLKNAVPPRTRAVVFKRFANDPLLKIIQLAGGGVRLLFDCRQQQRVQLRIFLLDLPGDGTVIGLVLPPTPPDVQGPSACGHAEQREGPWHRPTREVMDQNQCEAGQSHHRPASRQPAPQLPAPIIARDGLQMFFEEAVDHVAAPNSMNTTTPTAELSQPRIGTMTASGRKREASPMSVGSDFLSSGKNLNVRSHLFRNGKRRPVIPRQEPIRGRLVQEPFPNRINL